MIKCKHPYIINAGGTYGHICGTCHDDLSWVWDALHEGNRRYDFVSGYHTYYCYIINNIKFGECVVAESRI